MYNGLVPLGTKPLSTPMMTQFPDACHWAKNKHLIKQSQQPVMVLVPNNTTEPQQTMAPGGRFKNTYELLNLRALKTSMLYKNHIFQCMDKIFCVEFQRVPLKFHTKYLIHALKDVDFIQI